MQQFGFKENASVKVHSKIQKERTLHVGLRVYNGTEYDTNDNVTTEIQSIFHRAHEPQHVSEHVISCAHSPVVRVVTTAHHIVAQVS